MTTISDWVDAFRSPNLTVTGVARYYDAPPKSIDLSGGAVAYPWLFGFGNGDFEYSCNELNEGMTMRYEVVTQAVAQSDMSVNYQAVIDMMDNVIDALRGMTIKNFMSFSLSIATRAVGDTNYWAVIADVTGTDKL